VQEPAGFERFPLWIVVLSNLVSLTIYALGAIILAGLAAWLSMLYVLYCLWLEIRVLKKSCADCTYYGKVCGFGKGKLCALLFKQGNSQRFAEKQVSWADVLPDFGVSVFPLFGGIVRLIVGFSWPVVIAMVLLALLSFGGSAVIRGSLVCRNCKQRGIGCPAQKLFAGQRAGDESG